MKLKDHRDKSLKLWTGEAIIWVASKEDYENILSSKFEIHGRPIEISKAGKKRTFETAAALYKDLVKELKGSAFFKKWDEKGKNEILGDFIYTIVD